jgi:hypothetical protein
MDVSGQHQASAPLPPGERGSSTHWIGGWVGPIAVLGAVKKNLLPLLVIEPPAIWPIAVTITTELSRGLYWKLSPKVLTKKMQKFYSIC